MGPLPFASPVGAAFASAGDSTYVFGGYECWTEEGKRRIRKFSRAWRYDFAADAWTRLADAPFLASGWCAAAYGESIILLGGGLSVEVQGVSLAYQTSPLLEQGTWRQRMIGSYSDLVMVYDIPSDRYRILEERLPTGNNDVRCALVGNTLYVAGGETVDGPLSNCSELVLVGTIQD
jgi:N-acetylneuraminic acid mutarotase